MTLNRSTHAKPIAVFDLDGTLIDTAPDLMEALNGALATVGLPAVTLADTLGIVGQGARVMIERGLNQLGAAGQHDVDVLLRAFLDHYEANIAARSLPYPGLLAALDRLQSERFVLAVCTNKMEHLAQGLLAELGMTERFVSIVGGDTAARPKPAADPLLLAQSQSGGGPAVMIGDSATDANAAKAAGWPCILVDFGYTDRPARELGADVVISHFDQLDDAIHTVMGSGGGVCA
jgi:phosphoglycolate phosphatase